MKQSTKKVILLTSLLSISSSVLADNARHSRIRDNYKNMNICSEIQEDLVAAEQAYRNFDSDISQIDQSINRINRDINQRVNALESRKRQMESAKQNLRTLKEKKRNKPQMMRDANASLREANAGLPQAKIDLDAAKARKRKDCNALGELRSPCRKAKRNLDRKKKAYNNLVNKRDNAQVIIRELNSIDAYITKAKKSVDTTTRAYRNEESINPSIASLKTQKRDMQNQRNQMARSFERIEDEYIRKQVRLDKCKTMRYEAKKAPAFKDFLVKYATQGCDSAVNDMARARKKPVRDGIKEAYELVCESDILIQDVGQCTDNNNDGSIGNDQPSPGTVQFISDSFTTGSPYGKNLRNGNELKKVFSTPGAKRIKLDIASIDVEAGYDYVYIYDARGNQIAEITNQQDRVPTTNYSTGWIEGDTLTVVLESDGRTERSGFSVDGYEVQF